MNSDLGWAQAEVCGLPKTPKEQSQSNIPTKCIQFRRVSRKGSTGLNAQAPAVDNRSELNGEFGPGQLILG